MQHWKTSVDLKDRHKPPHSEVKSKKGNVLSFKPDYLERLKRYADLVSMPLLIAWKFHNFWLLFEARHMKKLGLTHYYL